ncbi:Spermidine Putrescine ABC transporter permease component potC (TC_3.A.1.11.1) [Paraburkholderia unamae]|uniref:ABC transporter permease n=1 Tax=Paraburkholderia unamae TaxID=219649 RepID=UPI001CB49D84|nr:ABC transporter permease [Paraburkholderia unamae]CAG9257358.1 Spermidine Putrescine ABC transporter permease component potC (TC_3.A.1.11.1) [Paraburkholderia unamae]
MRLMPAFEPSVGLPEKVWYVALRVLCYGLLAYLALPIVALVPLSFSADSFLVYPVSHWSLHWYRVLFTSDIWWRAIRNSFIVAPSATVLATVLGTLCALGLDRASFPGKRLLTAVMLSPLVAPLVVVAVGMYLFYMKLHLAGTFVGLVIAHALLGAPFVVTTVGAVLKGFNRSLVNASLSLGAGRVETFFRVTLPLILPGVLSGALFAFATSFDEVVITLFLAGPDQATIPRQMFSGIRDSITPTIVALATILVLFSTSLLVLGEWLRRKSAAAR